MSTGPTRRQVSGALLGAAGLALLAPVTPARADGRLHRVAIHRFKFEPARLAIRAGDRVEWQNLDIAPHTATAKTPPGWDTGRLARQETATLTFAIAGEWSYVCVFHPQMRAEIIVELT